MHSRRDYVLEIVLLAFALPLTCLTAVALARVPLVPAGLLTVLAGAAAGALLASPAHARFGPRATRTSSAAALPLAGALALLAPHSLALVSGAIVAAVTTFALAHLLARGGAAFGPAVGLAPICGWALN